MIIEERIIGADFRNAAVTALRAEADIICTNPPFSLFREFIKWLNPDEKKFLILGNMNAITYTEVFHFIADNKLWLGYSIHSGDVPFYIPDHYVQSKSIRVDADNKRYVRVPGIRWFTNLNHRGRTAELPLLTKAEREQQGVVYQKYDNYDAIEVSETKLIPRDYGGVMGVPISFLDKYNPEQFEVLGLFKGASAPGFIMGAYAEVAGGSRRRGPVINKAAKYARILIKNK